MVDHKKEFIKIFKELTHSRSSWQVWADMVTAMACSLANSVDHSEPRFSDREKEYADCIARLGGVNKTAEALAVVVNALEHNPDQDFLGALYMELELGNHWKGQYFTPYNICQLMSEMTIGEDHAKGIETNGYIAVNDCACGAGATLVAAANTFRRQKINFQNHVLFIAQDIDRVVGMMCYIQLSLLGCPGYVVIANSLTNPTTGSVLFPDEKEGQEFWYTPMFFSNVWNYRRLAHHMDAIAGNITKNSQKEARNDNFMFFFDFNKEGM